MASAQVEFRCFVGGLAWATDNTALERAFTSYGEILESKVINDRETGRSRGFGFVTFSSEQAMRDAIDGMNGHTLDGRNITVNEAQTRGRGGSGGGYGGGGYSRVGGGYGSGGGGYSRGGGGYGGGGVGYGGGGGRRDGGGYNRNVGGGYGGGYGGGRDRGYGDSGSRYSRGGGGGGAEGGSWRN